MQKRATYRQLAKFNRRIAEGRDRVALARARVVERSRHDAVDPEGLLSVLERSLQAKIQYRAMLMRELEGTVQLPLTRRPIRWHRR